MSTNEPDRSSAPADSTARTVLVVEDDPSITMGLEMNLTAEGYRVMLAHDGEEGLTRARENGVDLVILDVMLPRLNGFEVLRTLRREGNHVPVLMLSARGAEMDKVMGLELGAEDYVTKPFGLAELLARIKAVLRRNSITRGEADAVRAGDLEINAATREVRRAGEKVSSKRAGACSLASKSKRTCGGLGITARRAPSTTFSCSSERSSKTIRAIRVASSPCVASAIASFRSG